MRLISILIMAVLLVPVLADQRDGSNGVPFLAPDPSLKTTDTFMANLGGQYIGGVQDAGYALPAIFGGPSVAAPVPQNTSWMNLTEHNKKLNSSMEKIIALNSYDLTETQMKKANITAGQESWL